MPSAAVGPIGNQSGVRPENKGLAVAGLPDLPHPSVHKCTSNVAPSMDTAAAAAGLASLSAAAQGLMPGQPHLAPTAQADPAKANSQWSFARRQSYGPLGRRSFERGAGGVATALAEQQQRRLRRRDAKPAAKQRAHAKQLVDAMDPAVAPQHTELRNRELSGARLQQAAAAASAAHDAISAAVAEACQQQQQQRGAVRPVTSSTTAQGSKARGTLPPAAQQQLAAGVPEQPPAAPQHAEAHAQPQQLLTIPAPPAAAQPPVLQPTPAARAPQATPQQAEATPQQPAGGLSFKVSDGDDWALRQRSGQLATPQNSLPLCLQWMDALGSGSIPQLVPVTPASAAATAAPPLPPSAPGAGSGGHDTAGQPGVGAAPKLRPLRPRRRAKLLSFPASPAALTNADAAEPPSPGVLNFGTPGARNRLARSVSNSSTASVRRSRSSGDFSSARSVSPFAAYSDTPFEDDDQF